MIKKIIRLRRTKWPSELRYIHEGVHKSTIIQPSIAALEACGWFVSYVRKRTDKTNLMLTSVETDYTLRDEGVHEGCFFKNNQKCTCAICKQII